MTNFLDTHSPTAIAYGNLIESLTILSQVKEKDKIQICDHSSHKIAIEDRWLEGTRRTLTRDGCAATGKMIDIIMSEGIYHALNYQHFLETRKFQKIQTGFDLEQETKENETRIKYRDLIKHMAQALHGMSHIRNLYWSQEESEHLIADELTVKIYLYHDQIKRMHQYDDLTSPSLPDLKKRKIIPPSQSTTPTGSQTGDGNDWKEAIFKIGQFLVQYISSSFDPPYPKIITDEDLKKSLTVLSQVKEKNKIQILENLTHKIAIEDRWFESTRRTLTRDGCAATAKIVDNLMSEGIYRALDIQHRYLENKVLQKTPLNQPIDKMRDEIIKNTYRELKTLLVNALHGMSEIRDLYASPKEGEYQLANELTIKIYNYHEQIKFLFRHDAVQPRMPTLKELVKVPPSKPAVEVIVKKTEPILKVGRIMIFWASQATQLGKSLGII